MTSEQCIDIIKDRLIALVDSGQLKATYKPSVSTISFYVNDIDVGERPLLTLRLSDHRPDYQNYIQPNLTPPSSKDDTNVSIEFYTPKYDSKGKKMKDIVNKGVKVPLNVNGVLPFVVCSYKYAPNILDSADVDTIYQAILSWINGGSKSKYVDPFVGTEKEAVVKCKLARIKWNVAQNITVDNNGNYGSANAWGADYVSENNRIKTNRKMNKKLITLTEADLHTIVEDVASNVMNSLGMNGQPQQQQTQQPQQQQGQQQNNQATAFQQQLVKYLNQMSQSMMSQFQGLNQKIGEIEQQNQFISKQIQQLRDAIYSRR